MGTDTRSQVRFRISTEVVSYISDNNKKVKEIFMKGYYADLFKIEVKAFYALQENVKFLEKELFDLRLRLIEVEKHVLEQKN